MRDTGPNCRFHDHDKPGDKRGHRVGDGMTTAELGEADKPSEMVRVIAASSVGTAFEWYDFFIYGSLAPVIAKHFFAGVNDSTAFIFALLTFGVGFGARPFGAFFFGRIGDRMGRKWAFLMTVTLMGLGTVAIGFLPTYARAGVTAPILLIACRVIQGFALGGEYGGAAIYVAEHAPHGKRGWHTSFIQTSAAIGLVAALAVILAVRSAVGEESFASWGWRVPFLLSLILVALSIYIRMSIEESPVFQRMKEEGRLSEAPYRDTFLRWSNLKIVLIVLFAIMMAQGVIWYTAYFQAQFFMERVLKIDPKTVNWLLIAVTIVSALQYCFFGWLSDHIGRKPILLFGIIGAVLTFFPGFSWLTEAGNPALAEAMAKAPVTVIADPAACALQFDPVGKRQFTSSCDVAKSVLASAGVAYRNEAAEAGQLAHVTVGGVDIPSFEGGALDKTALTAARGGFETQLKAALAAAGYPAEADPGGVDSVRVFLILLMFMTFATALYGPQAAALVELFPSHIRYTALSVPYHIGTGWFGGFLPAISFAIVAASGSIYAWIWYPVLVASAAAVLCLLLIPETRHRDIHI
jgi:predicted MFS family arabinose efflux permease